MASPRTVRTNNRSPTFARSPTLSQILELSPKNNNKNKEEEETTGQDFANFHSSLKFIPQATEKYTTSSPTARGSSLPKITGSINLVRASILESIGSRNDSPVGSPLRGVQRLSQRKNTLELQLPKHLMEPESPTSPSKLRIATPVQTERASPRVLVAPIDSPLRLRKNNFSGASAELLISEKRLASQKAKSFKDNRRLIYKATNISNNSNRLAYSGIASLNKNQQPDQAITERPSLYELDSEEKKIIDKIEIEGMRNFQEKLNMHNRFSPRRLFEPEEIPVDLNSFTLRPKRVTNSNWRQATPLTPGMRNELSSRSKGVTPFDILDIITQKGSSHNKNPSLEMKFLQEVDKPLLKSQSTKALGEFKVKDRIDLEKKNDPETLKRIKEMTASLKVSKPLTTREKEFLNLVKEGVQMEELTHMIINNKDLVNIRDNRRETPLHWAAKKDFLEMVELLCTNGANVNAIDLMGRKPIDIALKLMNNRVIRYLEKMK